MAIITKTHSLRKLVDESQLLIWQSQSYRDEMDIRKDHSNVISYLVDP